MHGKVEKKDQITLSSDELCSVDIAPLHQLYVSAALQSNFKPNHILGVLTNLGR